MSKLIEKREELAAKQAVMSEVITDAKLDSGDYDFTKVKGHGFEGDNAAGVERCRSMGGAGS